jgi:hypothetical protein
MPANCPGNGPYSRRIAKGLLDGRSANGRYVRQTKAELIKHLGRPPTFPERMLIEQTAIIGLRLALAAEKIGAGEVLTINDNNQMIAWQNAFRRNLVELGLEPAPDPSARPRTVEDVRAEVAEMVARQANGAAA